MRIPNNIIEINQKDKTWRKQLIAVKNKYIFYNEKDELINPFFHEIFEQYLTYKWIKPDDIILELGARYGIVSCSVNQMLNNKKNHVVVEPDKSVHSVLSQNKKNCNAKFTICKNPISNIPLEFINIKQYGLASYTKETTNIKKQINITFDEFIKKYKLKFNVLIIDCEGCLCNFLIECPREMMKNINCIIFEKDNEKLCNYEAIVYIKLKELKFSKVDTLLNDFQQVWTR